MRLCLFVLLSCLQDLSVGKLDCTPDPIFSYTTYTLQDLQDIMPAQVRQHGSLFVSTLVGGPLLLFCCAQHHCMAAMSAKDLPLHLSRPATLQSTYTPLVAHLTVQSPCTAFHRLYM
jgi:hypothetical protein